MKKKNHNSQDKKKNVEEKELGQRGKGESGKKKEKEDGGENEQLSGEEGTSMRTQERKKRPQNDRVKDGNEGGRETKEMG